MGLSNKSSITKRVSAGVDNDYLTSLYKQACYAFGESWNKGQTGSTSSDGDWAEFPDIVVKSLEIGSSRRILGAQFIGLSRILYTNPKPFFPQVDKATQLVRQQFLKARWRGDGYADGQWDSHIERAYMDGDGLGVGHVQIGLVSNPKTGFQRVTLKHIPAWQCVFDRHARHPAQARWVCFQHYLDPEDAVEMFGDVAEQHIVNLWDSSTSTSFQVVRIYEYYDLGIGGAEPTMAVFLGSFKNEPFSVTENPFGCLPWASYVHFVAPGMRRPVGRIALQMSTQEGLNELERYIRSTIKRGAAVDIVDADALDESDLRQFNAGNPNIRIKRVSRTDTKVWERIPAHEIPQTILIAKDLYERQLTSESGVTDFDRGTGFSTQRTATETNLVDTRSQIQGSWSKRQAVLFYQRLFETVTKIAAQYDRDPVELDVFGTNVLVNNPEVPESSIAEFLREPSFIEIDQDSLDYRDVKAERAERLALLNQIADAVQMGLVNPVWYATEKLKAIGETNEKEALNPQIQQMTQNAQMMQGQEQQIA